MTEVRTGIISANRTRTGWLDTSENQPYISSIKSAFESKPGQNDKPPEKPTPPLPEPTRTKGTKVSTIANIFQSLSPNKAEPPFPSVLSKAPKKPLEKNDKVPFKNHAGSLDTQSHLRFQSARAMFEQQSQQRKVPERTTSLIASQRNVETSQPSIGQAPEASHKEPPQSSHVEKTNSHKTPSLGLVLPTMPPTESPLYSNTQPEASLAKEQVMKEPSFETVPQFEATNHMDMLSLEEEQNHSSSTDPPTVIPLELEAFLQQESAISSEDLTKLEDYLFAEENAAPLTASKEDTIPKKAIEQHSAVPEVPPPKAAEEPLSNGPCQPPEAVSQQMDKGPGRPEDFRQELRSGAGEALAEVPPEEEEEEELVFEEEAASSENQVDFSQPSEVLVVHANVAYHVFPDGHYYREVPGVGEPQDDEEGPRQSEANHIVPPHRPSRLKFSTKPIKVYSTYSIEDYDRRNEDVDPVAASAEYELEKRIEKMDIFLVELEKGPEGLGLSIIGMGVGADAGLEKLGIFVKSLTEGGAAHLDNRIQVNDQIIEVDGNSLVGVTQAYAATVLRNTSGSVKFLIGREKDPANSEIARLISQSLQSEREFSQASDFFESEALTDPPGCPPHPGKVPSPASTPEEGEDVSTVELTNESSESLSPDQETLKMKLKEALYKNRMIESELKKTRKKLTELEGDSGAAEELRSLVADTTCQLAALQSKYNHLKTCLRGIRRREKEFQQQQSVFLQTLREQCQEYSNLMELYKRRVSLLECSLTDVQKSAGLPPQLPYDTAIPVASRGQPHWLVEAAPVWRQTEMEPLSDDDNDEEPELVVVASPPPQPKPENSAPPPLPHSPKRQPPLMAQELVTYETSPSHHPGGSIGRIAHNIRSQPLTFAEEIKRAVQEWQSKSEGDSETPVEGSIMTEETNGDEEEEEENDEEEEEMVSESLKVRPPPRHSSQRPSQQQPIWEDTVWEAENPNYDPFPIYPPHAYRSLERRWPVQLWSCSQVCQWLAQLGLEQHVPHFQEANITGHSLLLLDGARLKALGVSSSQARAVIKKKIKEMRAQIEKERKQLEKEQKFKEKQLKKSKKK